MKYGDGGEWPKGYGATVKSLARQIKNVGIAVHDLPPSDHSGAPTDPRRLELTRVFGYRKSLGKIFGHPIQTHTQVDSHDGIEFVTFTRMEMR